MLIPRFWSFATPERLQALDETIRLETRITDEVREGLAARGIEIDDEMEAQLQEQAAALEGQIETESTALFSTGRLWDDGIIHPADSRTVLGMAISAAHSNVVAGATEYGVWRH